MRTHFVDPSRFTTVHATTRGRALRAAWLGALLLPVLAFGGCVVATSAEPEAAVREEACPADAPDCDRIDTPCTPDDDEASALGPGSGTMGLTEGKTAAGKYRVWPKGRVPYKLDSSLGAAVEGFVLKAMGEWESKTNGVVRFEKATSADDTILVVTTGSLPITNHIGYRAGANSRVKLRNKEYITVVRHELGHVLGLHHEQRRSDRGQNIQVKTGNIVGTSLCKHQFNICTDCELIGKYNVGSVMHYRTSDLSMCQNGPVLLNKDGSPIKHTWVISTGDVSAIYTLYGAPATGGTGGSAGQDAGTPDPGNTGGAAGSGGEAGAGEQAGAAGAAGDDGIQVPDETGGAGGEAGSVTAPPITGGNAGAAPTRADGGTTEDDASCSTSGRPLGEPSGFFGVALAALALARRRRTRRS